MLALDRFSTLRNTISFVCLVCMMSDDEKLLFKGTPKAQKLLKESKTLARTQARRLWWKANGQKPANQQEKPNG